MRKNPFMLREPQHERVVVIGNSGTWPFVLSSSLVEGRTAIFLTTAEHAEFGVFFNEQFTPRPLRLGG
jgi:hypothetical protein